jgi:hypothetical protein
MDPVKIREALGLDPDASDDEVKAVMLTAAGAISDESPPEPAQPALFDDPPTCRAAGAEEGAGARGRRPGTVVLASSVWDETQDTIKKLQSFVDKTQRDERDQVIAKAVQDGKFTPAQRTHFSRLWDADPTGTRALIDNLTRNSALAVMASGYVGDGDEDIDRGVRAPVPAAGEGGQPWLTTHRSTPAARCRSRRPRRRRSPAAPSPSRPVSAPPASAPPRPTVIGVFAHDAASGAKVTVWPLVNVEHEIVCANGITAAGGVQAAATGQVDPATTSIAAASAAGTLIGIATTTATSTNKVRFIGRT